MGDRCYMSVTCRPRDKKLFEDLGLTVQEETGSSCLLVDQEVNYALHGELPAHIPYIGYHGEGSQYGAEEFCCDGSVLYTADCDKDGNVFVLWDEEANGPDKRWVKSVRNYYKARAEIEKLFHEDPLIAQMAQTEYLSTHPTEGQQ